MAWRRKSTAQPDGDHRALMEQQAVELRQAAAVLRENAKAVEAEMRKAYAEIEELQRQNEILTRLMGSHAEEAIRPDSAIEVDQLGRWRLKDWKWTGDAPRGSRADLSSWQPPLGEKVVRGKQYSDWAPILEQMASDGEVDAALDIAHECMEASESDMGYAAPFFVRFAVKLLRAEREYDQASTLTERWLLQAGLPHSNHFNTVATILRLHASTLKEKRDWDDVERRRVVS